DTLGRTWQCGTVQLDFQMPQNFELEYTDENNEKQRPIMVHRVCYGSIERFIGILTEHFAGKFPVWLAPVQAKVLLVSDKVAPYGREIYEALRAEGIRVELDDRNEKIGYMIREAQVVGRVPYMLVIGQKEAEEGNVSIRNRDTTETETMPLADFITKIKKEIRERV
ncbi:MAG: threonine--tRNA ligase, partial [Clostridia bacterium]|nr:threonine--tRNA ligase [Clostridia bacterium]